MKRFVIKNLIRWYQACDKELPQWLVDACRRDKGLLQERQAGDALTCSLKAKPESELVDWDSSLVGDVMSRIAAEDLSAEKQSWSRGSPFAWRPVFVSLAAVAVFAVALQVWVTTEQPDDAKSYASSTVEALPEVDLTEDLERIRNPLDQEVEYALADARSALGFLANRFVPSSYLEKMAEEDV